MSVALAFQSCCGLQICDMQTFIGENPGTAEFSWKLDSRKTCILQEAYQIDVTDADGQEIWTSGKVSDGRSVHIPYEGPELSGGDKFSWSVTVWTNKGRAKSNVAFWFNGLAPEDWTAEWIGLDNVNVDSLVARPNRGTILPARYLRKEFKLGGGRIKDATLHICGIGSSYVYINGRQVGEDDIFGPLPTVFWKSDLYLTYDVTDYLGKGVNAIGVLLGNGRWYRMRDFSGDHRYGAPRVIAQLKIRYDDGTEETVATDGSWSITDRGPIRENNEFDGEVHDDRMALGSWTETGYIEDSLWRAADVMPSPKGILRAAMSPCLRVQDKLHPVKIWGTPDGRVMLDMGQNMVGRLKFTLSGHKDTTLTFRYAEVLKDNNPDSLYVANLRTAMVRDIYIPGEDGRFTWAPALTYHGFRYAEITGLDYIPEPVDITGEVIYDGMQTTGTFESSNEILNAIHHNAFWGIRGNYRGMPTDCPQRDERMGWLGDRATGCYGESYIFDNEKLYVKWMLDIEDSMREDGMISDVSPRYYSFHSEGISWPYAYFTGMDMLVNHYGNSEVLRARYPSMKRWVEWQKNRMVDGIAVKDTYGDWCMPPESPELIHSKDPSRKTSKPVIASTLFYDILLKMSGFASISGHPEDSAAFADDAALLKENYNARYLDRERGCYDNNTVTANIISADLNLVPDDYREKVIGNAVSVTDSVWNNHVSTGVIGIQHLMRALSHNGHSDLALKIATAEDYPSWGYMIRRGATTIWELWNGDTADPAMNSRNHVMLLGDLIIWFYEDLAGIRPVPGCPAFKHFELSPIFPEGLNHVKASYDSPYGEIISDWTVSEGGSLSWKVKVPANTTATMKIPAKFSASGNDEVLELGSGNFTASVRR